ncbi:ABC transporter permease [Clostridium botulinum]|uniref:ABC transporter permease n=1 Tax=Clostridium botulinum TaxID=1491 RepID=UPI00059BDB3E|nr:ABC transporter permease [Clostridium botulinum]KIN82433.1 cell division protein FtsX [Clostridium botulinum]MCC5426501.1 ABC transporter permease [Clostridium botulinum]
MNSYMEISNKYFRQNKRRSIVNIIAIILATMFISSTGHMMYSSQQNIINMIREDGDYHFKFELPQKEKFSKIKGHSAVEKASFCRKLGSIQLGEKALVINEINKEGFSLLGVRLKEGRFPKKANEIILSLDLKEREHKKIGDKITGKLDNNRNIDYTIVGFSQFTNKAFLKTFDAYAVNDNGMVDSVEVYVKLREVKNLNNKIDNLAKEFNIDADKIVKNEALLTAMGEGRTKSDIIDYITFFMVAIIVMIATLIFIYNSLNISTVERMKEYGLIKAIGGTNKQIKKIILKEVFIIGAISLPIGLLAGMASGSVLFRAFNSLILSKSITIKIDYSLYSILGTIIITIITLYLSVISILGKVKKISPLDCFTNRSCDLKKVNTRNKKLINKFFSIEEVIANRNIRTNKGRFRTTVISVVLSITIFITFSSLVSNIEQLPYEALPIDNFMAGHNHYFINIYNDETNKEMIKNNSEQIKRVVENVKKIHGVKDVYRIYQGIKSYTFIPEKKALVKGESISIEGNKYTNIKSEIVPIDLDTIDQLSPYLLKKFNDKEKMKKEKGVYITQISYENDMENLGENKYNKKNITTLKVGDEILIDTSNLMYNNKFESNSNTIKGAMKVKILGVVRVILFDKENFYNMSPIIYMPKEVYNELIEKKYVSVSKDNKSNIRKKRELDRLKPPELKGLVVSYKDNVSNKERGDIGEELLEQWRVCSDDGKIQGFSIFSEKNEKYIKFSKLFYFSVIAFISIISMANVFNIVNTNVILRSKELALLSVVGASRKSIKKIMYLEGMLYSIIGIIYGNVIGWINSILINMMFRTGHDIAYVYPFKETLISIVFFMVVGILAIYFPLRKIKKENLLQYKEY